MFTLPYQIWEYKMSVLSSFLLALSLLFVCDSAFVDKIKKCSVKDSECLSRAKDELMGRQIGKTGIPELNIAPFDPLQVTNESVTVVEGVTLTVTDGVIKGMSNCVYKNFTINLEKSTATQEILCGTLYLKGQFVVAGKGEMLKQLVGTNEISGHGKAKGKIENMFMKYVMPFKPVKKDDGEIYISVGTKGVRFTYDIGKATFSTEKVFINNIKEDLSDIATAVLNTSWKLMFSSAGSTVMDRAKDIYMGMEKKYFDTIPAKEFFIEDLSPYVKN